MRVLEDIIGKEVIDNSAAIIGKIKDVEFNFETREIEAIVINKGGISENLGISKGETIVPYDMIRSMGDKILLTNDIKL